MRFEVFVVGKSAFNTGVQSISDDAFLIQNFTVCGYVRIPGSLGLVLFANLGSKRYIQRKNGARCGGSEYFGA